LKQGHSIIRWWIGFWRFVIWIVDAESTAVFFIHVGGKFGILVNLEPAGRFQIYLRAGKFGIKFL
jgi:hypothetical protein